MAPESIQILEPPVKVWLAPIVRTFDTATNPVPVVVVVELDQVKERLEKSQAVSPPKLVPAPLTVNVPPVILISPFPLTSPPLTVTSTVPERVPAVTTISRFNIVES